MSRRLLATAAAIALGASVWAASPSPAGVVPSVQITPTSGPSGTTITVTGVDCLDEVEDTEVFVSLFTPDGSSRLDDVTVNAAVDGSWSAEVTVPATPIIYGDWHVGAICETASSTPVELFEYDSADFTVPAPTTTTTTPPTTPPATEPPAALPVAQEAPFTG